MGSHVTPAFTRERAALDAVLISERFIRSPRLGRLLSYLCQKYFDGQAESIKEYNIAIEVLGRSAAFDPSQDAIARVEAHRLRKKLREYYAAEGADNELRILLSPGTYVPEFVELPAKAESLELAAVEIAPSTAETLLVAEPNPLPVKSWQAGEAEVLPPVGLGSFVRETPAGSGRSKRWLYSAVAVVAVAAGTWLAVHRERAGVADGQHASGYMGAIGLVPAGAAIRVMAGAGGGVHIGRLGHSWEPDFYYTGGSAGTAPHDFIARTSDPTLFQNFRTGEFSYAVPLAPGTYELHLFFVETMYGPGLATGGGENSRTFMVWLNGQVLLSHFDVISDAGGPNIADERVFRDVHPAADGKLHLQFTSERGQPVLSALSLLPGTPNRQLPVRLVAQETSVNDHEGHIFEPDSYYKGGQIAMHRINVSGTLDGDLYAGERYGNFSYAIPVDARGIYGVKLYLAEEYWGSAADATHSGPGKRLFNVDCNGVRLIENLDLYRQAGEAHALTKMFHRLRPNAQGKLVLSFEPVENYASVYAIEVLDEGR